MKKLFLILFCFLYIICAGQNVDLQAVSIDPSQTSVKVKENSIVTAVLKNNGPSTISSGEATCQVTFNNTPLSLPTKLNKKNKVTGIWKCVAIKRSVRGQVNLFFKNTEGDMKPGSDYTVTIYVAGKNVSPGCVITLASSLSGTAKAGDIDGSNQSVSTQLIVTK